MIIKGCKALPVLNVKTRVLWSVVPCNLVSIGTIGHSAFGRERKLALQNVGEVHLPYQGTPMGGQLAYIVVGAWTAPASRKTCVCVLQYTICSVGIY